MIAEKKTTSRTATKNSTSSTSPLHHQNWRSSTALQNPSLAKAWFRSSLKSKWANWWRKNSKTAAERHSKICDSRCCRCWTVRFAPLPRFFITRLCRVIRWIFNRSDLWGPIRRMLQLDLWVLKNSWKKFFNKNSRTEISSAMEDMLMFINKLNQFFRKIFCK